MKIENVPAAEIILRYDSPQTLFYCDPPYPHATRGDSKAYGHEMSGREHEELAQVLGNLYLLERPNAKQASRYAKK